MMPPGRESRPGPPPATPQPSTSTTCRPPQRPSRWHRGDASGGDRERGRGERRRQVPDGVPRQRVVRPVAGEPADVDRAGAGVTAAGDLRRAEVAAARPGRAAADPAGRSLPHALPSSGQEGGCPSGQRRATPQVSSQLMIASTPMRGPSVNGSEARASTPICTQTRPSAFTFSCRRRAPAGHPVEPVRPAERAARPQHRDELRHLSGVRGPDQVAGAVLADESLGGRLHRDRPGRAAQGEPDRARRAAAEGASVRFRPDAPSLRHPCVCHGGAPLPRYQVRGLDHRGR